MNLKGKKALVLGLGRSGIAATRFLHQQGALIDISDTKAASELSDALATLEGLYTNAELGIPHTKELCSYDLIVKSPGIRDEKINKALSKHPDLVWSETELGLAFYPHKIIAITGTNGKTTTGTMISDLLSQLKISASPLCGNNGRPVCDYLLENEGKLKSHLIVELSSFMLEMLHRVKPHISIVLNISPHHINDHGGTFDDYLNAKVNLARQTKNVLILNALDSHIQNFRDNTHAEVRYFSKMNLSNFIQKDPALKLTHLTDPKTVTLHSGKNNKTASWKLDSFDLPGFHNKDNLMAALQALYAIIGESFITQTQKLDLKTLRAPPHRLQLVYDKDNILVYNDAKSSNIMSVANALKALPGPVHLICGGKETQQNFDSLIPLVKQKVKTLLLIGQTKERLNRTLGDHAETFLLGSIEEALLLAYQKSRIGDQVLFSPGCPSYDMFKDFEERGEKFNGFIAKL